MYKKLSDWQQQAGRESSANVLGIDPSVWKAPPEPASPSWAPPESYEDIDAELNRLTLELVEINARLIVHRPAASYRRLTADGQARPHRRRPSPPRQNGEGLRPRASLALTPSC
jgi:hypothetical protein